MNDLRARFGSQVKWHRLRNGLTQPALAYQANIGTGMVSKVERGQRGPRFDIIAQLANALNVDAVELFAPDLGDRKAQSEALANVTVRLASLSNDDLQRLAVILDALLQARG